MNTRLELEVQDNLSTFDSSKSSVHLYFSRLIKLEFVSSIILLRAFTKEHSFLCAAQPTDTLHTNSHSEMAMPPLNSTVSEFNPTNNNAAEQIADQTLNYRLIEINLHRQHNMENHKLKPDSARSSKHLSVLYALLCVSLGFVFPISVYMSEYKVSWMFPLVFYYYMLIGSIVFLLYIMICLMNEPSYTIDEKAFQKALSRNKKKKNKKQKKQTAPNSISKFSTIQSNHISETKSPPEFDAQPDADINMQNAEEPKLKVVPEIRILNPHNITVKPVEEADFISPNMLHPNYAPTGSRTIDVETDDGLDDQSTVYSMSSYTCSRRSSTSNSNTTDISRKQVQFYRNDEPPATPDHVILVNAKNLGLEAIPPVSMLSVSEAHSPSFFLRIGCFLFGFFSVIHDFFSVIDQISNIVNGCSDNKKLPKQITEIIKSFLHVIFMVLQTFFIFKHSKASVNYYQGRTSLGMMHLLATNLCIWMYSLLLETSHSASFMKEPEQLNSTVNSSVMCMELFWIMGPYLFPFTVEYSLMAAVSCYVLFHNVGRYLKLLNERGINRAKKCLKDFKMSNSKLSIDCYKSEKGFFMGALTVAVAVVSAVYFLYTVKSKNKDNSPLIYHITDIILLVPATAVTIYSIIQLRKLKYKKSKLSGPDGILLRITLMGVITLKGFECMEGVHEDDVQQKTLHILSSLLGVTQSLLQTYLVVDGENRHANTEELRKAKPGRESIAFMMMLNTALWMVYSLETRELYSYQQYHMATFNYTAMLIMTFLCVPLLIFFRFHSTCCLVEIWGHAFSDKRHGSDNTKK